MDNREASLQVLKTLQNRGLTLSTAESCTGGMIGAYLTAIPGSSRSYKGGVISYCDELKHKVLGVPQEILDSYGAVSPECAQAMAAGARNCCCTDISVSVTGLAGPDSDSSGLPVGLVYIGYSDAEKTFSRQCFFEGNRDEIRSAAAAAVFRMLLDEIE